MEKAGTTVTPGEVVGSGAGSVRSVQQHEQEPLMQARGLVAETQKLKVMVALDDSDGSFYALNWAITNLLKPKSIAPATTTTMTTMPIDEEGCMVYLVHVQHPFTNYVYPAGPGLHTGMSICSSFVSSLLLVSVLLLVVINI